MKKKFFIPWECIGPRLPITSSVMWWLFLDKIAAPQWAWGVMFTLLALIWIVSIIGLVKAEKSTAFQVWFDTMNGDKSDR